MAFFVSGRIKPGLFSGRAITEAGSTENGTETEKALATL
jgi:hypothetical protein